MEIRNDDDLKKAVDTVNENLQEIQNYLGRKKVEAKHKVRFPRGFIRTASYYRSHLSFIEDVNLKKNISYILIFMDILNWVINRTDVFGTAREMIVKVGLVLMASICESYCVHCTKGIIGKNKSFKKRTDLMADSKGIISSELRDDLQWLWGKRDSIHFYELKHMEYGKYKIADYNRAVNAVHELSESLLKFKKEA